VTGLKRGKGPNNLSEFSHAEGRNDQKRLPEFFHTGEKGGSEKK
jgi:hypothetical protein